jgi:multicomponent Na+:H+ antiporter subunit D
LEVPIRAFFSAPPEGVHRGEGIQEAPWPILVAMVITALATLGLFINPGLFYELMTLVVN